MNRLANNLSFKNDLEDQGYVVLTLSQQLSHCTYVRMTEASAGSQKPLVTYFFTELYRGRKELVDFNFQAPSL